MKKTMLSVLALSSVVLLAGCNNAPAEEEVIVEENTPEEIVIEEPEIEIVPAEEEIVVEEEIVPEEEVLPEEVEAEVAEAEPVEEVIAE